MVGKKTTRNRRSSQLATVWVRIVAACLCFAAALWLTDGDHVLPYEWPLTILALIAGMVLGIDATLARVRVAIDRANERRQNR